MNIQTCTWDTELLEFFELPKSILPEIRSSSEVYGYISDGPLKVHLYLKLIGLAGS